MNIDDPWPDAEEAWWWVLKIQTKLHRWATDDSDRRFDDLYNLVYDPAVLVEAWQRVKRNRGARSAGVDGQTAYYIKAIRGEQAFLSELRDDLKARRFQPAPVREVMIPKPDGKRRRLGIATVRDRVVQAALKMVLEPIFEADFQPCSYGFRPGRRAQDAIAEIHFLTSRSYEWVVEGDIKACFDEISHSALLERMRGRIGDKRVLGLVKAFLKSGILGEDHELRESSAGAPQGGILSPLLSNIALSVLDDHFAGAWKAMGDSHDREYRRRKGLANYRLVRYCDDFVVLVAGNRTDAEYLRDETARVLLPMGLRLSEEKTKIVHIDEGFDFLGMHIQRHKKRGAMKRYVYTYPSRRALAAVKAKVRSATRGTTNQSLSELLHRLNPVLRGWTNYHRHGASSATFSYLSSFTWRRVWIWLRHKHPKATVKELRRRYLPGWRPTQDEVQLFKPDTVAIVRYRYRANRIPSPWATNESAA
ncbi:MAG TPA: group II intron reverse transcriptase/maturase [Acidimicrobiales bacterium]|nr:group II intron reverse transcriptase/maturase [Acidimicrobiales bacterium]